MGMKKMFYVVAYDISDDKCRSRVVKVVEKFGVRINYSVYECLFTPAQFEHVKRKIEKLINAKEDLVIYYPICLNCFSKIVYQPPQKSSVHSVVVI